MSDSGALRVLVVGGGAREHALVAAIRRSPRVAEVLALPGNAGIAQMARCLAGKADDVAGVVEAARAAAVDFVVIGPDAAVVAGLADALAAVGLLAFGPSRAAAELEGSKSFCKRFLKRHGIATAPFEVFDDADAAEEWVRARGRPMVVKADGLALGKGVVVASDADETCAAIDAILRRRAFGDAGARIVIEERLRGREVSFHAICDGRRFVPLAAAQDHKRVYDGDGGPNTGGMGAYSPPETVSPALHRRIIDEVIAPTVAGLAADGRRFRGVLYAGLMLGDPPGGTGGVDAQSIDVLEFNVRFGDPETAVLLARLPPHFDLVPYLEGAARGDLGPLADSPPPVEGAAVCVVIASEGYPGSPVTGDPIAGVDVAASLEGVSVFHAGTTLRDGVLVSSGGRVLCVTAVGSDLDHARARAYRGVECIHFRGSHHRGDIAGTRTPAQ